MCDIYGMKMEDICVCNAKYEMSEIDGQCVIFEPSLKEVYVLHEIEKTIFDLFDGNNSLGQVLKLIKEEYVDFDDCVQNECDLKDFISSLIERSILVKR